LDCEIFSQQLAAIPKKQRQKLRKISMKEKEVSELLKSDCKTPV